MNERDLGGFQIGDSFSFRRRFGREEFEAFALLSGDRNPLHHDESYARRSGMDRIVVPLHLAAAPLSAIAGMVFPGRPSLYLSHDLRALDPVRYDREVEYSARVVAIHEANRVLSVRVVAWSEERVVLEGELRVQIRDDRGAAPSVDESLPGRFVPSGSPRGAVVTGGTGAIGRSIARSLSKRGYRLLIQYRGGPELAAALASECSRLGREEPVLLAGDLEDPAFLKRMADLLAERDDVVSLVHAASPRIGSPPETMFRVNYGALAALGRSLLPSMLRRQEGSLLLVGSGVLEHPVPGWEDYAASKSAASQFLDQFERRYSAYGPRGTILSPGYVSTGFSEEFRPHGTPVLLPEEVAECVADLLDAPPGGANYVSLQPGRRRLGRYGVTFGEATATAEAHPPRAPFEADAVEGQPRSNSLEEVVRALLHLGPEVSLHGAGLDATPGWDSLRHIELLTHLESRFNVRFTSTEIDRTRSFSDLAALLRDKVSP